MNADKLWPIVVIGLALGTMAIGVYALLAMVLPTNGEVAELAACRDQCTPHVSRLISAECHCAVDDGWIKAEVFNGVR